MLDVALGKAPQDRFGVGGAEPQRGGELDELVIERVPGQISGDRADSKLRA
jgi:hypothetical protein